MNYQHFMEGLNKNSMFLPQLVAVSTYELRK